MTHTRHVMIFAYSREKISLHLQYPGKEFLTLYEEQFGTKYDSKEIRVGPKDSGAKTSIQLGMRARKHDWNLKSPVVGK